MFDNYLTFKKFLVFSLIGSLIIIPNMNAINWHEQRLIAKELGRKADFDGSFRFAYYEDKTLSSPNGEVRYFAFADCPGSKHRKCKVTFYKQSLELSKHDFGCLVHHELGHVQEVREGSKEKHLDESFADDYMVMKDKTCERWYP